MSDSTADNAQSSDRVVVVGMDMGDARLVRQWAERGLLPTFTELISRGTWIELDTTAGILHTSTWPTFATGDKPGKHGVYYPFQPSPGHQEAQRIEPDQYRSPTFWMRANGQGVRSIVFDVPETFPEANFDGKAIFEWGTWAWYGQRTAQPEDLLAEIKNRFGPYPLKMEAMALGLKFPNQKMLEARLLKSVRHKCQTFQWLLEENHWDLAVTVFGETHPAGHYLWPSGASQDMDINGVEFDPIRKIYMTIDGALGSIQSRLPEGTSLMVVSGDGVTTNHCGWHLLPDMLEKLGYSVPPQETQGEHASGKSSLSLAGIKRMLPHRMRRMIADHLPRSLRDKIGEHMQSPMDWSRTRAFALPTDLEGCIRINLKGREPQGIVEPGAEYDRLCEQIVADMQKLVNPATGRAAVRDVWVLRREFDGPAVDHLPDITVTWNNDAPIRSLTCGDIGTLDSLSPDPRTGTHSNRGFCLAVGTPFTTAATARARLVDVGPTVLALLGKNAAGMDGESFAGRHTSDSAAESPKPSGQSRLSSQNL